MKYLTNMCRLISAFLLALIGCAPALAAVQTTIINAENLQFEASYDTETGRRTASLRAPYRVSGLTADVVIPSVIYGPNDDDIYTVTSVREDAFALNSNNPDRYGAVTSLTVPASVTAIGPYAFTGLTNLNSLTLSEGLQTLGVNAFAGTALSSVTLPASLNNCTAAFGGCHAMTEILVADGSASFVSDGGLLYSADYTRLVEYPAGASMTTPALHEQTTEIGDYAFYGCSHMTSFDVPRVTSIGCGAFRDCISLASVAYPEEMTVIPEACFQGCSALASFPIPGNIVTIGQNAFYFAGLTSLTIPASVHQLNSGCFQHCEQLTGTLVIPGNVTKIDSYCFGSCTGLNKVFFSTSELCHEIGMHAFSGCSSLNDISISSNIVYILDGAFENCPNLMTVRCWGTEPPIAPNNTFRIWTSDVELQEDEEMQVYRRATFITDPTYMAAYRNSGAGDDSSTGDGPCWHLFQHTNRLTSLDAPQGSENLFSTAAGAIYHAGEGRWQLYDMSGALVADTQSASATWAPGLYIANDGTTVKKLIVK